MSTEDEQMSSTLEAPRDHARRVQWIQTIPIAWMSLEAAISLAAAWIAHSPALFAFGGDSALNFFPL